ncbi:hypothetical protein AB0E44_09275 [Micrococcus terreus]|uniref:hypothetical protein n=1 Tax=Micrococcus terreus TaxID=574650 RepID=UPI0033E555D3
MSIETRLAEIRARAENATEGPWSFQPGGFYTCGEPACCSEDWDNRIRASGTVLLEDHQLIATDAEFIAASRTDVPTLLAAVEAIDRLIRPWEASEVEAHSPGAGFHAALQFAAHHVRAAITTALETQDTTREDPS